MLVKFDEQFGEIVRRANGSFRAYLCDGDSRSAVIWDPYTEITIRLALRNDEIWVIAGSGVLVRFVAASDDTFSDEDIDAVMAAILRGDAVEYFGGAGASTALAAATGFDVGSDIGFSGGLGRDEAQFAARLAGPLAAAQFDSPNS